MNVVILIGNLASDVDVRDVGDGRKVAHFRLAVDRRSAAGGADFVDVTVWEKQAEACERFLSKGRRVAVDGRLRSRTWDDAEGKRKYAVEVVANSVEFLSARGDTDAPESPFADVVELAERSAAAP